MKIILCQVQMISMLIYWVVKFPKFFNFLSSIQLWSILKKKPIYVLKDAHPGQENWITSVAALSFSDLIASGSKDGFVRLWKCGAGYKSLECLFTVEIVSNLFIFREQKLNIACIFFESSLVLLIV